LKLRDDILRTLTRIEAHATDLQATAACTLVRDSLFTGNDARALREKQAAGWSLPAVVEWSTERWMNGSK